MGSRSVKAFQFLHPEVKAYYEPIAHELLNDLSNTVKGEKFLLDDGEGRNWTGTKRMTSESIARIKDDIGATYADIEKALDALMQGGGAENNALSKRIELVIDDMLTRGYTDFENHKIPADKEYIQLKKQLRIKKVEAELPMRIASAPDPKVGEALNRSIEERKLASIKLKEEVQKKINAYVEKYGELEKGSKPARNITVPKKTSDKTFVRRNTRTIAEAEAITDEKAAVLLEEVANDESWTTYERFGDKQAIDAAVTEFERLGYDAALTPEYGKKHFRNIEVKLPTRTEA